MTNPENRQADARTIASSTNDHNGDLMAMAEAEGFTGEHNGRLIQWANNRTGNTNLDLNGALQDFASTTSFNTWDELNNIDPASSGIETVEFVSAQMTAGIGSGSDTPAGSFAQDNTILFPAGYSKSGGSDDLDETMVRASFDGTSANVDRIATNGQVDWNGFLADVPTALMTKAHYLSWTVDSASTTNTSSTVNATLADCAVLCLGSDTTEIADANTAANIRTYISGSDTAVSITAEKDATGDTSNVEAILVEMADYQSIQEVQITKSATTTTATISSVDLGQTLLFPGSPWPETNQTANMQRCAARMYLQDATTVAMAVASDAGSTLGTCTAVEFPDGTFTSIENIPAFVPTNNALTSDITLSTPLTDTSTAFVIFTGWSCADAVDINGSSMLYRAEIIDANTVRVTRAATTIQNITLSLQVVQP